MLIVLKEIALLDTCSVSLLQVSLVGLILASRTGNMGDGSLGVLWRVVVTPSGDQFGSKNCRMFFFFFYFPMPARFTEAGHTMLQG